MSYDVEISAVNQYGEPMDKFLVVMEELPSMGDSIMFPGKSTNGVIHGSVIKREFTFVTLNGEYQQGRVNIGIEHGWYG